MMSSKAFTCKVAVDTVCYTCGLLATPKPRLISTNPAFCEAYEDYFGFSISHQTKSWAPHVTCNRCYTSLVNWSNESNKNGLPISVPVRWHEPFDHVESCYFCWVNFRGLTPDQSRKIYDLEWPDSANKPIFRPANVPPPKRKPKAKREFSNVESQSNVLGEEMETEVDADQSVEYQIVSRKHRRIERPQVLITQAMLNDLAREMPSTSISDQEVLASRLYQWGALAPETCVTKFRNRHQKFSQYFSMSDGYCHCHNFEGLTNELGLNYQQADWRLFIDAGKRTLKAILLHNGNEKPSIPLVYSRRGESRQSMEKIMRLLGYGQPGRDWMVVADFKVLNLLRGVRGGNSRYPCPHCRWRSTGRSHAEKWGENPDSVDLREDGEASEKNLYGVDHPPLVHAYNLILPPLHIKLGLMSSFVKALARDYPDSPAFAYLNEFFAGQLSKNKICKGCFNGPQIRKLMADEEFERLLGDIPLALAAWRGFVSVVEGFLGNNRAVDYESRVKSMLAAYRDFNVNMSLKIHVLHAHLDFFADKLGALSEESGERFHQDIFPFERRFAGSNDYCALIGDYFWCITPETDLSSLRRQSTRKLLLPTN